MQLACNFKMALTIFGVCKGLETRFRDAQNETLVEFKRTNEHRSKWDMVQKNKPVIVIDAATHQTGNNMYKAAPPAAII